MALDRLLIDAPILANMKFVHWYEKPLEKIRIHLKAMISLETIFWRRGQIQNLMIFLQIQKKRNRMQKQADDLVTSIVSGKNSGVEKLLYDTIVVGVNGRVMVRYYEQGSYELLQKTYFYGNNSWNY